VEPAALAAFDRVLDPPVDSSMRLRSSANAVGGRRL
jgi:hypothetical protein